MLSITGGVCFMRLLIAEDEKSLSRALAAILTRNNYSVDTVYDGEAALEYLEATNYDGLILDVMMPKMDGISVLKTLRARGNTTPVLILSAKSEIDDKVLGLDSGANDYLTKPFDAKELLARIRAITRIQNTGTSSQITYGNITLDCATYELSSASGSFKLANREFQMMELLIAVSMVSLCIVLFCIFGFVGILNYQKMVSDVVEETVQSFQALARTQNKTFETLIQPMISLHGDEKSFTQLVFYYFLASSSKNRSPYFSYFASPTPDTSSIEARSVGFFTHISINVLSLNTIYGGTFCSPAIVRRS